LGPVGVGTGLRPLHQSSDRVGGTGPVVHPLSFTVLADTGCNSFFRGFDGHTDFECRERERERERESERERERERETAWSAAICYACCIYLFRAMARLCSSVLTAHEIAKNARMVAAICYAWLYIY
jgi:hypothetical protein